MGERDASPAQTAAAHPKSLHSQLRYKRLERGAFKWPPIMDGVMRLSAGQLAALIEGLDWTLVHVPRVPRPQATQ
jgi:transposase